ncbi:MAG: histidinol-phosphatase [Treponema sp.]|jgi:histidinol-phosphatase (PHP family)|nr:histidinol-phosphatase [Treponema sp.]
MNSYFSSLHNHTVFCDGRDDVETMCRTAYEKKLHAVGFSAHAPLEKKAGIKTFWNLPEDKKDEYIKTVLEAKSRWEGKLKVLLGFEVDYIKGLRSALDDDIASCNSDYLIGAVHFIVPPNGTELFTIDGSPEELMNGVNKSFGGDINALMHAYYDASIEMIQLGGFNILAHPDIIKKNYRDEKPWNTEAETARQKEVAVAAAKAGITVEVNTGGINRGKINETYPSLTFLRMLRENNVPVIITADAHRAEHINGSYDIAVQTLIQAGYTEHEVLPTLSSLPRSVCKIS